MFAFMDGEIREVEVPEAEVDVCKSTEELLERIFYYGQNDFQPRQMPSVSVGDVAQVGGRNFICASTGWKEMTKDELLEYSDVPKSHRVLQAYKI